MLWAGTAGTIPLIFVLIRVFRAIRGSFFRQRENDPRIARNTRTNTKRLELGRTLRGCLHPVPKERGIPLCG